VLRIAAMGLGDRGAVRALPCVLHRASRPPPRGVLRSRVGARRNRAHDAPLAMAPGGCGVNVLYITAEVPYPLTSGYLRHFHFLAGLSRKHTITHLSL